MNLQTVLSIILCSILSENIALLEFLGTGAVLENERPPRRSIPLGLGTTVVMLLTTAITWPLNHYVLEKTYKIGSLTFDLSFLQIMTFVLVVLLVVELLHLLASRLLDRYCRADFVKFAINGAVLGLCIHNTHRTYLEALVTALGMGLGFMLAMTVFAKLKDQSVDEDAIPAPFRGLPIALLTAGMMVLVLLALKFE